MEQVDAFLQESDLLAALIEAKCDGRWDAETQFKSWTVNDVITHLYFWNKSADLSLTDPAAFKIQIAENMAALSSGGIRNMENEQVAFKGGELFEAWKSHYREMAERWKNVDPKQRLDWVGPTMSARSSITARQMETWAHGHEIFDLFGVERQESDRIKNIVILGVNTFGFSYQIRKKSVPEEMPKLILTAPSGDIWEFGSDTKNTISGSALAFAQSVTQTRNYLDTDLTVDGDIAQEWMENAQCFAGSIETPPTKGSRFKAT